MIEFIKGEISELTPTSVILENAGMGYEINISVNTYTGMQNMQRCRLYIHEIIREDAYLLFGFLRTEERESFRKLIGISGVGANTARMILSSMTVEELESCILSENTKALNGIKGIGLKTAQRIIVELKDKVSKNGLASSDILSKVDKNPVREEAVAALSMLGFSTSASAKVVAQLLKENPQCPVEQVIKAALKLL